MPTKINLLFVDDDPNVLAGLRRLLRRFRDRWTVHCVDSGMEALKHLSNNNVDAIISDMRMPEMDGAELLHHVADHFPSVFRFVLSGQSELDKICRVVDVAHQFMSKPCDSGPLENMISHVCDLQGILSNQELKTFVTQLKTLPCTEENYQNLGLALANSADDISRVSTIISTDLGMSTKILQLVNTSFFGESRSNCTAAEACRMLGIELLQRFYADTRIFQPMTNEHYFKWPANCYSLDPESASSPSPTVSNPCMDNGTVAGNRSIVQGIGRLIFASFQPEYAMKINELVKQEGLSVDDAEQRLLGNTSYEVGAYLLALWGFPSNAESTANFGRSFLRSE